MLSFYTLENIKNPLVLLMFSGGIEKEHRLEMGYMKIFFVQYGGRMSVTKKKESK